MHRLCSHGREIASRDGIVDRAESNMDKEGGVEKIRRFNSTGRYLYLNLEDQRAPCGLPRAGQLSAKFPL